MNRQSAKRVIFFSIALAASVFLISAILIAVDGLRDDLQLADVAIVPGNTVQPDGLPSPRLQARLDKTVELYRQKMFSQIIVSGGIGAEGFDEAEVMKKYLVARDVPENCIYTDSNGTTTFETAKNASLLMRIKGWQSALVISQYFHLSRAKLAVTRNGVSPVYSAHADYFELRDVYSLVREIFGYGWYFLRRSDS